MRMRNKDMHFADYYAETSILIEDKANMATSKEVYLNFVHYNFHENGTKHEIIYEI